MCNTNGFIYVSTLQYKLFNECGQEVLRNLIQNTVDINGQSKGPKFNINEIRMIYKPYIIQKPKITKVLKIGMMSTGFINLYEMNTKQMQLYMQITTCGIQNSCGKLKTRQDTRIIETQINILISLHDKISFLSRSL